MKIEPIILEGRFVKLEPLSLEHFEGLAQVAFDESIWKLNPVFVTNKEKLKNYIETALIDKEKGIALPFATIERSSNKIIGSTRFGNIDVNNRRVEIGWTWIHPDWQRTAINTEAKFLMLRHAFETWDCLRVELKTDVLNEKSRNAILRIGAKEEGIFRQHVITESGRIRDTIYFSIINSEWLDVKNNLLAKLQ